MKSLPKIRQTLRRLSYRLIDFVRFRIMVSSKQMLVIGGSEDPMAKNFIEKLRPTWRVTSIDYQPFASAHTQITLNRTTDLDEQAKNVMKEIGSLKVRFDSVFCFYGQGVRKKISDPKVFDSLEKNANNSIYLMLLGAKLACQYIQNNGFLLLTGKISPFTEINPEEFSEEILHTQTFNLALSLLQRKEDEFPLDASIGTFLREDQYPTKEQEELVVALMKQWADGKSRPPDGSFFKIKFLAKKTFLEYV